MQAGRAEENGKTINQTTPKLSSALFQEPRSSNVMEKCGWFDGKWQAMSFWALNTRSRWRWICQCSLCHYIPGNSGRKWPSIVVFHLFGELSLHTKPGCQWCHTQHEQAVLPTSTKEISFFPQFLVADPLPALQPAILALIWAHFPTCHGTQLLI